MAEAKIGAKLPTTIDHCGLHDIAPEMVRNPEQLHYAIILLDTGKTEIHHKIDDFGERYTERVAVARIRSIEPLRDDSDVATAARLLDRARTERMGGTKIHLFPSTEITGDDR
jgi:hypothetical protein